MKTRTRDLTTGSPMKLILAFAAPLLFGFLFQQFYSFVDTAIVGRFLGANKLAAVGGTGSLFFMVMGFVQGACSGFAIPIAQAFGAKDEHQVRKCVASSVYLSGGLSVIIALLTGLLCPAMLRLMNTPEEIISDSVAYIRIIFLGIPVTVLYNMSGGILRSLGDSRTPVLFLIIASLINVALDLLFIIVVGLDVAGAALATLLSQLISGLGCVLVMKKRFPILRMSADEWKPDPRLMKSMLLMGVPMGLQFSITAIGSVVVQWSVNGLGVAAVAAVAAGSKLSMFFGCVFDALATTMATYSGQNMGARKINRIAEGMKATALLGTIYVAAAVLVIHVADRQLLSLFVNAEKDPDVMAMASHFIRMNSDFYLMLLFVNILRLSIQGMGFTRLAMFAGVFEMVARTTVALVLVPRMQFNGACLANPAAWTMADVFLFPCFFHCLKALRQRLHVEEVPTTSRWKRIFHRQS